MKKVYLGMVAALALFASCDPLTDDVKWSGEKVTAEQLANSITLEQYDYDEATGTWTKSADGNWVQYYANKPVEVYYFVTDKKGNQKEMVIGKGDASGRVYFRPGRGSSPEQTLYFRTREIDGSSVTAEKKLTVQVPQALTQEQAYLCSEEGVKAWQWDFSIKGHCWGNMGAAADSDLSSIENYVWWGVDDASQLADQANHAVSGDFKPGEADNKALMVFNELGTVTCYDKDGNIIREGTWKVKDFNPEGTHTKGTLETSEGATLFPYEINAGGKYVTKFQISEISDTRLVLYYPDNGAFDGWSEATYWQFSSCSSALSGNESQSWTWDTEAPGGAFWGNAGYQGGNDWANDTPGKWWGVTSTAEFADQQQHRGKDNVTGDDDVNAYMTFFANGDVKSFNAAGEEIRSGTYNIFPTTVNGVYGPALNTTEGSILWPYAINKDGFQPYSFELVYLTADKMALVYADEGTGAWAEATFWRFKKK